MKEIRNIPNLINESLIVFYFIIIINKMDKLPTDIHILIALELEYPELISLCRTSKIINNRLCKNITFWNNKFIKEFPNTPLPENPKLFYKSLIIGNNKKTLEQLFMWIKTNVKLTDIDDNREALENNLKYNLDLSDDNRDLADLMGDHEEHWGNEFIRLIPEDISLESYVYLPNNLCLINTAGINDDDRGTEDAELEFGDFHSEWRLDKGLYNVYDLANAFYKIKSHKFDNWYEWVQSIYAYYFNKDKDCIEVSFYIDHGS